MSSPAIADKMIADIRIHLNNNNTDKAREIAVQAVADFPQNADLVFLSGYIALKSGEFSTAVSLLEKCSKIAPYSAEVKLNLGLGYQYDGQLERACENYQSACKLDPNLDLAELLAIQCFTTNMFLPGTKMNTNEFRC